MHKNLAVMDCHVDLKLAFQQIHVFFIIYGCSWRQKKSPAVPMEDIAPQTIWLGGCFTVGRVYFSSCRAPAGLQTRYFRTENLTYRRLVRKKYSFPDLCVPVSMSFGKVQTFFCRCLSQAWFSHWLT